jgi:hypothetical protein
MNVYQKLNLAREKFHQSEIKKSGYNTFSKYYYFELSDFLIPALRIFKEVGLVSVTSFQKEDASMRIFNVEKPEEFVTVTSPMSEAALKGNHAIQNLGAVQTYMRRYLWLTALEIVEHDEFDAVKGKDESEVKPKEVKSEPKKTVDGANISDVPPIKPENSADQELFVTSMIDWGSSCETAEELKKLWKVNQKAIDALKSNEAQYKRLIDAFAEIKKNFEEEK